MQHALMRLGMCARRGVSSLDGEVPEPREVMLSLADYEAIGGLKLALSGHADLDPGPLRQVSTPQF